MQGEAKNKIKNLQIENGVIEGEKYRIEISKGMNGKKSYSVKVIGDDKEKVLDEVKELSEELDIYTNSF